MEPTEPDNPFGGFGEPAEVARARVKSGQSQDQKWRHAIVWAGASGLVAGMALTLLVGGPAGLLHAMWWVVYFGVGAVVLSIAGFAMLALWGLRFRYYVSLLADPGPVVTVRGVVAVLGAAFALGGVGGLMVFAGGLSEGRGVALVFSVLIAAGAGGLAGWFVARRRPEESAGYARPPGSEDF